MTEQSQQLILAMWTFNSNHSLAVHQAAEGLLRRANLSFEVRHVVTEVASATHALYVVLQLPWRLQDLCDPLGLQSYKGK